MARDADLRVRSVGLGPGGQAIDVVDGCGANPDDVPGAGHGGRVYRQVRGSGFGVHGVQGFRVRGSSGSVEVSSPTMVRRILLLFVIVSGRVAGLGVRVKLGGPIAGVVIDASGAPVAGAAVTIEITGKPARTAETGVDGRFRIDEATAGEGTLRVRAGGFAESVTPLAGDAAALRVVLQPRPLTESVTVTASRGATGVDTAASSTIVSSAELLTSAAGAIDDALRNTPGFSLFRRSSSRVANPTTQGVTLRGVSGSGASRTLVVADGWALNDPVRQLGVLEPHSARGDRSHRSRARGDRRSLRGGRARRRHPGADARRRAAAAARAVRGGGSHETYRASGFGGRRFGDWSLSGGDRRTEHRRRLHRRRRGARRGGCSRLQRLRLGIRRRWLRPRHVARDVARPTWPTKAAATARRCRSTTPTGASSRAR